MKRLSKDEIILVLLGREWGESWSELGSKFHVSGNTLRRAVDPEFDAQYRKQQAAYQRQRRKEEEQLRSAGSFNLHDRFVPKADVEKARTWLDQSDTRDLTGLFLGDPFPGRSALDQRQGQHCNHGGAS